MAEIHSSNIRFNMDNPTQARAWDYLQDRRGRYSYGQIVSEAIVYMIDHPDAVSKCVLDESDVERIADAVCKKMQITGPTMERKHKDSTVQNGMNNGQNREEIAHFDTLSDEMFSFADNLGE